MSDVLILGANSDIALAAAKVFASKGYNLILAGRDLNKLERAQHDIVIKYKVAVRTEHFDALDIASHQKFMENLKGIPKITLCAFGLLGDQKLAENDIFEALTIINTNFTGVVSIINRLANYYEVQKDGIIVGIGSVAGDRGRQSNYIYGSSKAAFSTYFSGLRNRLFKSNCHVLEVKPGYVDTKMTSGLNLPGPLTAKPEDVARKIYIGVRNKSNVIYVLGIWKIIMLIIRNIPEFIFKRLNL